MYTTKIEIDEALVAELTDILGIESRAEAVEFAIRRVVEIAEIEALNAETDGAYGVGLDLGILSHLHRH